MADQRRTEPTTDGAPERLRDSRKVLIAAGIGGFVEYFDFGSYGFLAVTLSRVFFPSHNPTVALLQTFGVFAVAYALRPLGGLVFGHFGDKAGRPRTIAATVIMMSIGTAGVGVLPGYATLGIGAPILLIVCRVFQGFSAGGEYNGAAVLVGEYAPARHRGLLVSAIPASGQVGLLTSSLVSFVLAANLPAASFAAWGWRIPFLLAVPFGLIGLYLRLRVDETPVFREVKTTAAVVRAPVLRTVRVHYRQILTSLFGFCVAASLGTYLTTVYIISYLTTKLKFSPAMALLALAIALVVFIAFNPISGAISDRVGRKPVLIVSLVGLVVLSVPSLFLISRGSLLFAILGLCLIAPMVSAATVVQAVVLVELFPTKVRYTGGMSNNLAQALFAGTAPLVATSLVAATGSPLAPGFYIAIVALIGLIVATFALRETHTSSLVHDQDLQQEYRPPARADVITDTA